MERKRYILVDSSTKRKRGAGWGKSVACWAVFDSLDRAPIQVGLVYYPNYGPNLTFLSGVINGLRFCVDDNYNNYTLIVFGDCEPAINVIIGKCNAYILAKLRDRVSELDEWLLKHKEVSVRYGHIPRTTRAYQPIDKCAKEAADFICKRFKMN